MLGTGTTPLLTDGAVALANAAATKGLHAVVDRHPVIRHAS